MTTQTVPTRRKQLADQLDRFDLILDGLADGLNEAVADVAREDARAAVREVLTALLTDPDLLAAPADPTPPSVRPSFWSRVRRATRRVAGRAAEAARAAARPSVVVLDLLHFAGGLRRILTVADTVGVGAGLVALLAPQWVGAALTGAVAAAGAVAAQVGAAVRPLFARSRPA